MYNCFFLPFAGHLLLSLAVNHPDDGGSKHLWNDGLLEREYTALYLRRLSSSYSPPWEPKISSINFFWKTLFIIFIRICYSCAFSDRIHYVCDSLCHCTSYRLFAFTYFTNISSVHFKLKYKTALYVYTANLNVGGCSSPYSSNFTGYKYTNVTIEQLCNPIKIS
jgi:hypothetical protein